MPLLKSNIKVSEGNLYIKYLTNPLSNLILE